MSDTKVYTVPYKPDEAPKLGLVFNSIKGFSEDGKQHSEKRIKALFKKFKDEGVISKDSILYDTRIFGYHQAELVAEEFVKAQVDVILIFNSAFPNGYVFPVISMNPYLKSIPIIIAADEEPNKAIGSSEWATNSICGNDMNNYVAKYIGRYARFLDGSLEKIEFQNELRILLNVYHTVIRLRHDYLGRFGDAPGGFHSASGDQLLYFKIFGTIVNTVDLLRVEQVYNSMETAGPKGTFAFTEQDIQSTIAEVKKGRLNLISDPLVLYKGARLYHTLRALIKAEGFTSAAFKCWPEITASPLHLTPCLSMGWALSIGDVTAFACESDWPSAVLQTIGTLLTGMPSALLDFVNWTPENKIIQLGHCGIGIPCIMEPTDPKLLERVMKDGRVSNELREEIMSGKIKVTDALISHGVSREAGINIGPTLIGQFKYGIKTGFNIVKTMEGKLKMLVFTGESRPDTNRGILYSGTDIIVKNYKELYQLKREHGFPHHLAVAMGDISQELKELCGFYGIDFISSGNL